VLELPAHPASISNVWFRDKLFQAYHATVDPNHTLLTAIEYENSWHVPIEVKYKHPEGRGVYAKEFIPEGTLVWESTTRNTATFHTSHEYRMFAEYLINDPTTRYLGCDITHWIDAQREWYPNQDEFVICQTLDEGVLLNTVWDDPGESINLVPDESFKELEGEEGMYDHVNDCFGNDHYVASMDIQAGEQFRIDYGNGDENDDLSEWWRALGMGNFAG
jgi:hypothetical protein